MTNDFDALTQDVGIGGIRTKFGIRILLCYILRHVKSEVSRKAFGEILRSSELVNFFEINPALDSLCENGLVTVDERDNDDYFTITGEGIAVAEKLETDIPIATREKALATAFSVVTRERLKGSVDYKIEKSGNGFYVTLTVYDGDELMMETKLFSADYLQAQLVGENFVKNPDRLYNGIIDSLV